MTTEEIVIENFKQNVINLVTYGCSLPFALPDLYVNLRICLAYEEYHKVSSHSKIPAYMVIEESEVKKQRLESIIQLPWNIYNVPMVYKTNDTVTGGKYNDFSPDRLLMSQSAGLSNFGYGGYAQDGLLNHAVNMLEIANIEKYTKTTIRNSFDSTSRQLILMGDYEGGTLVLHVNVKHSLAKLCAGDHRFMQWCAAIMKRDLGNLKNTYKMPLIGGAEYDAASVIESGEKEIEQLREDFKLDINPIPFNFKR